MISATGNGDSRQRGLRKTDTMTRFAATLLNLGLATADTIRPCSPKEVAEVCADQGVARLPAQYEARRGYSVGVGKMSYIFDARDETVWSPALRIGQTYIGCARQIAVLLDIETGLNEVANDMIDIDLNVFRRFTRGLLDEHLRSGHPIHRALSRGTLLVSLVLLDRSGWPLQLLTPEERDLNREAMEYAAWMPS